MLSADDAARWAHATRPVTHGGRTEVWHTRLASSDPRQAPAVAPALQMHDLATHPVYCLRVESAKPPVIFRVQPRGPGEAGDIIVLRDAESPSYRTNEFRMHVLPPEVPKGRVQTIRITTKLSTGDLSIAAFAHRDWHAHSNGA